MQRHDSALSGQCPTGDRLSRPAPSPTRSADSWMPFSWKTPPFRLRRNHRDCSSHYPPLVHLRHHSCPKTRCRHYPENGGDGIARPFDGWCTAEQNLLKLLSRDHHPWLCKCVKCDMAVASEIACLKACVHKHKIDQSTVSGHSCTFSVSNCRIVCTPTLLLKLWASDKIMIIARLTMQ